MKKLISAFVICLLILQVYGTIAEQATDSIEISFVFNRMPTIASNQFAVWIEDTNGEVIRTLYVTDFTGKRRGYEKRDMTLSSWVSAADPASMNDEELDIVSGATPASGQQRFKWDLTDAKGNLVPDGIYTVKIEGSLYWEDSILYSAEIDLGKDYSETLDVQMTPGTENHENETMLQDVEVKIMSTAKGNDNTANWLGGLSPADALEYMKAHYDEGLVIVEVNTDYWKLSTGFTGAMHIPHDQMAERYNEIPGGVPVILHCGAGVVSVPAYETLMEKRPDIPQLSYIAGKPPVKEFNEWLEKKQKR